MRALLAAVLLLAIGAALAEAPAEKPLNSQQQRMRDCNERADSKQLRRAERRSFMKSCLSGGRVTVELGPGGDTPPAEPAVQPVAAAPTDARKAEWRSKLGPCIAEAQAQELKAAERKAFMSACLKPAEAPAP